MIIILLSDMAAPPQPEGRSDPGALLVDGPDADGSALDGLSLDRWTSGGHLFIARHLLALLEDGHEVTKDLLADEQAALDAADLDRLDVEVDQEVRRLAELTDVVRQPALAPR